MLTYELYRNCINDVAGIAIDYNDLYIDMDRRTNERTNGQIDR